MARNSRAGETRIGHDARRAATGRLDTALREGRLDLAEYERRLVVIQAAKVQKDLTPVVADLPVHSGQTGKRLRIAAADRERALVLLAEALIDGRLKATAYADAEERLHRAVTYADLDAVVGGLDAKASDVERDQAIARVEAAVADGLLDPAEQHDRVAAVRSATTDAHLAALVADLPTSGAPHAHRASNADREAVAARLNVALEAGLIDLTEFDERVRAVYAARLRDELTRVVTDLPDPAAPPTPPAPARTSLPPAPPVGVSPGARRKAPRTLSSVITIVVLTSTVGPLTVLAVTLALGMAGFVVLPVLLGVVWMIVWIAVAIWGRGATKAAIAAETAPPRVEWFPRAVASAPRAPAASYSASREAERLDKRRSSGR